MTTKQSEQLFVYFSGLKYISARQILHFSLQNAPQFMSDKVITICIRAWDQQNTFRRYYSWADHYLYAVICKSRGGLSASGKTEKMRWMII